MAEIPYIFTVDESNNDSLVTLSALGSSRPAFTNGNFGAIEIESLGVKATSKEFMVDIEHSSINRKLSNRAIHAKTIFGASGKFFMLPKKIVIEKNHALFMNVIDLSDAINYLRFFLAGKKVSDPKKYDSKEYTFFYTTDSNIELSADEVKAEYITFDYGNFILHNIHCYSDGPFKFKVSNTRDGLAWSNGWIHSDALSDAEYNRIFEKIKIEKNSKLKIDIVDLSSATNRIFFTLVGINQG